VVRCSCYHRRSTMGHRPLKAWSNCSTNRRAITASLMSPPRTAWLIRSMLLSSSGWRPKATGCHISFLPLPRFEQIHCTNAKDYRSGGDPMQTLLRYPTVTCPGCKRPMMPSRPLPVSEDTELCDVTYTCEDCGATTRGTIKIEK